MTRPWPGLQCALICMRTDLSCSQVWPPCFGAGAIHHAEPQWKESASQARISQALLGASVSLAATCHSPPYHRKNLGEPSDPSEETTRPRENLGLWFLFQISMLGCTGSGEHLGQIFPPQGKCHHGAIHPGLRGSQLGSPRTWMPKEGTRNGMNPGYKGCYSAMLAPFTRQRNIP